jgi:transposase-like protein
MPWKWLLGATKATDMAAAYSSAYRHEMVRRLTGAGAMTSQALSRETGVAQSTLSQWLRDARSLPFVTKTAKTKTPEEKLRIVVASAALEGEELGAFLRREGIHEVELRDWRQAMLDGLSGGPPKVRSADGKQIRQLQKELHRKDKALAEAAALVLLKKKAIAAGLLEPEDDDTNSNNGSSS